MRKACFSGVPAHFISVTGRVNSAVPAAPAPMITMRALVCNGAVRAFPRAGTIAAAVQPARAAPRNRLLSIMFPPRSRPRRRAVTRQAPVALALGILPPLGSTLFAIPVQADFNAEALHFYAMAARLRSLVPRLARASQSTLDALARRFSGLPRAEHGDWRQMQQGRALDLP